MGYVLGIDISTTAVKAVLINGAGSVVAQSSTAYGLSSPHPLWSEQNPDDWWDAVCSSVQATVRDAGIPASDIQGIGLTGQMHGLVLLNEGGQVLRPAILWNDQRTAEQCETIRTIVGAERLISITGNDALTGFTAPKLQWVKEHESEIFANVAHVLLPKDFIRFKLTGEFATDKAGAGGTLYLDLESRNWSDEILGELDVPRAWLPESHEGREITGSVSKEGASATGLAQGTPVVAGGGDQAAQAVGVGAVNPDTWAITLGTSGVVFVPSETAVTDPNGRVQAFPHAVAGRWHLMGVMLSAASCLSWFQSRVAPEITYELLSETAATVAPGSDGLFFQPYLTGERTPHNDPFVRASFVGLTARHSRAHMTRAILEGVAFGLRGSFEAINALGLDPPPRVRISGGGAKNSVWTQLIADVLEIEIETVKTGEAAAFGAALLAGVGTGMWSSVDEACTDVVVVAQTIPPQSSISGEYRKIYSRFQQLYPMLCPFYRT